MQMQSQKDLESQITELIKPTVERLGYELWGIQWLPSNRILRIYIDLPGGVTLEDCERVSRRVSRLLDIEDPIASSYHLEISSPGWDRPLFSLDHFRRFVGHPVRITTKVPLQGQRRFRGWISRVEDEVVYLADEQGGEVAVPFREIEKARMIPEEPVSK